jgi:hypothetical protein
MSKKNTLQVDYGTRREVYAYCVIIDRSHWWNADCWCREKFKPDYMHRYDGNFWFKKEKDAVFFALRWA